MQKNTGFKESSGWLRVFSNGWAWRMAWRDSRRSRRRLLLFSASIVLGIAALVAINSLMEQMHSAVQAQAKGLLGADLVMTSRSAFSEEADALFASVEGEQAREIAFTSMVYFPEADGTRLAQIRAIESGFPFYGSFETMPAGALELVHRREGVLVEANLAAQFGGGVGDPIKIGEWTTRIAGLLLRAPGESMAFSTLAPRVYLPMAELQKTGLLREGSLARYKNYFKLPAGVDAEALLDRLRPQMDRHRLSADTVEERQRELGRAVQNVREYLNLIGFVALLLGAVGIASAIQAHIKQKLSTVAVLRCLGCSSGQAFAIYLAQAIGLGTIGALLGAGLGCVIVLLVPEMIAEYVPVPMEFGIAWSAVAEGVVIGLGICVLFALLPLLAVRRVSPLEALRIGYASEGSGRDPIRWVCYTAIGISVLAFSMAQTRRWEHGLGFAFGLAAAFAVLAAMAFVIFKLAKRFTSGRLPFVCRQGLLNLYRPQNRTVLLMTSLGLGTFLLLTLYLVHQNLVRELFPADRHRNGNAVLFDIQPDQKQAVEGLMVSGRFPVLLEAPIVTMRLKSVKGRTVEEIKADQDRKISNWVLNREYRSTYRDHLVETEKLVAGEWIGRAGDGEEPVPVSVETGIAERLNVGLGDELVFDVQGIPIRTRVASLREVDWRRLHPNFFVVFPSGVLEEAPSFHVILTRVNTAEDSARLQRTVVTAFPNVSAIDLTLILQTIDSILSKISYVIRFVALFTVGTGLVVLAGSVLTGRYQRIQESILLRTLGASRRQILQILAVEYFMLGIFASLTAVLLAVGASWALAEFVFETGFNFAWWPLFVAAGAVSALTLAVGLTTSRGISNHSPLEILRSEA